MMKRLLVSMSMLFLLLPLGMQSITPIQAAATAHARAAYERHQSIDPAIIQMIHDVVEQIAVPTTIADYARERDWDKVMEFARKPGVNVNAQDEKGCTALMYALYHGKDAVAWFLIDMKDDHGRRVVDLNRKDSTGCTSLMYTVLFSRLELFKYLIQQKNEHERLVFNLNDCDYLLRSILLQAAMGGNLEIVNYLVGLEDECGRKLLDLNAPDHLGETALMYAVGASSLPLVKCLTQFRGACGKRLVEQAFEAEDRYGRTVLQLASFAYSTEGKEIYEYLLHLKSCIKSNDLVSNHD